MSDEDKKPQQPSPEAARAAMVLTDFLAANPSAKVGEIAAPENTLAVQFPWGDESLNIKFNLENKALVSALNAVVLPERFIAIWHRDSKDLEIIFTALPLSGPFSKITERAFSFRFRNVQYNCQYADSSERLLAIAEEYVPAGPSSTSYRNLPSYRGYVKALKGIEGFPKYPGAKAISFWVRNIEWTEELGVAITSHLNFYATYYDTMSPTIVIVPPSKQDGPLQKQPERFPHGEFPKKIIGREVDDNLLHYWT